MKKILLLILLPSLAFSQSKLRDNSIGLCFINEYQRGRGDPLSVEVFFPKEYLSGYSSVSNNSTFTVIGNLKIYNVGNSFLLVDTTGTFEFQMKFWCENDGGIQYRPTATLLFKGFLGYYLQMAEPKNLFGYIVFNQKTGSMPESIEFQNEATDFLDINKDKKPEAYLWMAHTDAGDCDGEPKNDVLYFLRTRYGNFSIRCCGP